MGLFWSLYSHILSLSLPPSLPLPPHPPPPSQKRRGCLSLGLTSPCLFSKPASSEWGHWEGIWEKGKMVSSFNSSCLRFLCFSANIRGSHWNWDQEEEKKQILARSYTFLQHRVHTFWKLKSDKSISHWDYNLHKITWGRNSHHETSCAGF